MSNFIELTFIDQNQEGVDIKISVSIATILFFYTHTKLGYTAMQLPMKDAVLIKESYEAVKQLILEAGE